MLHHRPHLTAFDTLPKVSPENLRPGDRLLHRGRPGCDEGGACWPIIRTEPAGKDVRIVTEAPDPVPIGHGIALYDNGEHATVARAGIPLTLAPPHFPTAETVAITEADVRAAREHYADRDEN